MSCVCLGLAACGSVSSDTLGFGLFGSDEKAEEQIAVEQTQGDQTAIDEGAGAAEIGSPGTAAAPEAEVGQVIEVITPDTPTTVQPPPSDGTANAAAEGETLAALPPEPAVPDINDDPQQLIGMGPASLHAFLGAPEMIRREAPASLWQYRAKGCVLDVVLYPDRQGDKVTYLEAREADATKIPPRTCLNKLLLARQSNSAG